MGAFSYNNFKKPNYGANGRHKKRDLLKYMNYPAASSGEYNPKGFKVVPLLHPLRG